MGMAIIHPHRSQIQWDLVRAPTLSIAAAVGSARRRAVALRFAIGSIRLAAATTTWGSAF